VRVRISILLVTALSVASCASPPFEEDGAMNDTEPEIAKAAQQCGLDLGKVTFLQTEREQYLTFETHPVLSKSDMDCLAQVLVSADYGLRTDDYAFSLRYTKAWKEQNAIHFRKLANEWIKTNKPSLAVPRFSGVKAELSDFVATVVRLCKAPKGNALAVEQSYVYLPWLDEPTEEDECLVAVLIASNLHEHNIDVVSGGIP
jgi:hypothetical protein